MQVESLVLRPCSEGDRVRSSIAFGGLEEDWPIGKRHTRVVQQFSERLAKFLGERHASTLEPQSARGTGAVFASPLETCAAGR